MSLAAELHADAGSCPRLPMWLVDEVQVSDHLYGMVVWRFRAPFEPGPTRAELPAQADP